MSDEPGAPGPALEPQHCHSRISRGHTISASEREPIAIIGVGCRFPGRVESAAGLWDLAAEGRQTAGPVPADRWGAGRLAALHDPELAARAGRGCFLQGDVWGWEPEAFSVAPMEQEWVDPQFRVLMEVAWQAVEDAGVPMNAMRGSRTGVYMGTYAPDNLFREARPVEDAPNSAYLFGNFTAGAAGRVAFAMDLRGPVMVVSTHCSSGLVALDTACGALTLGECDTALAGAVLLMLSPETHYYEAPLLLSGSGACYAFDSRADGYVRGEGAGVLLLKRLADARRDGDRVLAVIRGSAVNNDGQASRLTAPSPLMQQQLFREAVAKAGVDPGEVGLVEAHGPGTAVGDPIEYTSINAVYGRGRGRCALGSIKTNIGHSEPVSGIAGTIKAVESLRRGLIAPNANFKEWNPAIPRDEGSRLFVPTELTRWPVNGGARLAAVCSYGVTGTNAHVVLESAPAPRSAPRRPELAQGHGEGQARLFTVSGGSLQSLALSASRLAAWAEGPGAGSGLLDVAHTLAQRRSHADHRLAVVARDHRQLTARMSAFTGEAPADGFVSGTPLLPAEHPGPVFVFTGQGSQRPGMCQGLLAEEPVFAAAVDELEPLIHAEAGFSLREVIEHPERLVGLERIQPALFGVQVALAAVWRSWGIEPAAVIGQSLGEVAAMVVAGGLAPADGAKVICRRSALLATISGGAMASVMLGAGEAQAAIDAAGADGVTLGVLTSPGTTVVSGDAAQIAALMERWEADGVVARAVDVDVASHSPQVDPVLEQLRSALADVPRARPRIPFYSTVSPDPLEPGVLGGAYWVRNQRDPVRFHTAVSAALATGHRLFIECTAHPLAVRPILETARRDGAASTVAVGTLRQGMQDQDAFLTNLGALHVAGYDGIDFATHYGDGNLTDLPVTDWHRTRHGGTKPAYRLIAPTLPGASQHPLLGGHVHDPDAPGRHLWQTPVGPRLLPWLADHTVADAPVLPGAGMVEMMLAAARVYGTDRVAASEVGILNPLVLASEPQVTVRLNLDGDTAGVEIVSSADDGVTVHARGVVRPLPGGKRPAPLTPGDLNPQGWKDYDVTALHRTFRDKHNVVHGPAFTALDRIQVHPTEDLCLSVLHIHESAQVSAWAMALHPALADQVVQSAVAAWLAHHALEPGPVVVAGFDEVRVYGPTTHVRRALVRLHRADDLGCTASARLATAEGTVVAEIRGLRVANITSSADRFNARLSHQEWVPAPVPEGRPRAVDSTWTILAAEDSTWPDDLARELAQQTLTSRLLPLATALGDPAALTPCTGVVLTLDETRSNDASATARAAVSHTVTLIRRLSRWEHPPRLWIVSRAGRSTVTAAAVRGLLRAAAYEHPELKAGILQFTPDSTPYPDVVSELLDLRQPLAEVVLSPAGRQVARIRTGPGPGRATKAGGHPVRPGAAYLVTGGLGGLGLLTVEWLARNGAGRIVISARSAPTAPTQARLDTLRETGTDIRIVRGDIADPAVTARALAAADEHGQTLRGVFHAAGVVEDATVTNFDDRLLERVWRGKATGAWALHQATEHHRLDHFVLYSSLASLIGSPGQVAYAAANAFLDGLATHRLDHALPATTIHWGAWSEVGRGQHLADKGFLTIGPTDGIDALERILAVGYQQLAYSPLDTDLWTAPYPAVRSSALLSDLLTGDHSTDDTAGGVRERLIAAATTPERRDILETFITETVRELLGGTTRHIGPHTSLVILGLDSLGAVQLQQRIQHALRTEMKPGVIWVKPSASALTDWLLEHTGLEASHPDDAQAPVREPTSQERPCP
ncbi:SDR family NAD(P)-dependent oxidoreductase [Kitasatospora purpeofusca]|uniref:type I polyketide synthase n=1 Tax=Kitasatospora purpeofusca TaxID=67352 RepID=UPI0036CDAAEA